MGIDYVLECPCRAKDNLTVEGIVQRLKGKSQAETIIESFRSAPGAEEMPVSQMRFTRRLVTPEGSRDMEVEVQALLDAAQELDAYQADCQGCPASVFETPFGCTGYIRYPIPLRAEQWLLELLPSSLESTAGLFLAKAIEDFGYDGAPAARMRAGGNTFFETSRAPSRKWGSFFKKSKISSDQLMHMMFFVGGRIEPAHSMLLCLFFGIVPHDISAAGFAELMESPDKAARLPLALSIQQSLASDEPNDFAVYLATLHRAASLGQTVVLDM